MSDRASFGRWLKQHRKARDLTQEALAEQAGCAVSTLRKLEAGTLRPSRQLADLLAERLALPPEERAAFLQAARAPSDADLHVAPAPPASPPAEPPLAETSPLPPSPALPSGTVTFLFTDIEGSTQRWEQHQAAMPAALARHDAILRQAIATHGGVVFRTVGDGVCAAFARAPDALAAALQAQRALQAADWGAPGPLRVRMALHSGAAQEHDGDYLGTPLNRLARLLATGHGGQTLLAAASWELVRDELPPDTTLRDLGTHRLKDLTRPEQIFQLVAPDLPAEFPPLTTLERHPTNLPIQPTPLIGREREVAAACDKLRCTDVRLLTLTGPGGVGKTRLGLQVAAELLDEYQDGIYFVALAPLSDPALVLPTIAQTLGLPDSGDQSIAHRLTAYLRAKQLLLLLDNCEQVLDAAPHLADLLGACPELKLLSTSRAALRLRSEHVFAVPPLALPDRAHVSPLDRLTQYAAVALFIARAQAVQPAFAVTNANAPAVAEICHQLDGLPLAIELAAARVWLFSPDALLARLGSRLSLLTGGARDLPARQQTIRSAIAWSYDLLDAAEQTLFRRLGVFVGGCTLDGAAAVCNAPSDLGVDVIEGVASLLEKSLLQQTDGGDGEARFTILETIREYALEQLTACGEVDALRHQHAAYCLALAEAAEPQLKGAAQVAWFNRLEAEHDNLRTALAWSLAAGDADLGLRLAAALGRFWWYRGYLSEGRRWVERVLARPDAATPTRARAKALAMAGNWAFSQGDLARTAALCAEGLALCEALGDQEARAWILCDLGWLALAEDDPAQAAALLTESLALYRELGDQWSIALLLWSLGDVAYLQGNLAQAQTHYQEALALSQAMGDRLSRIWAFQGLAEVATRQGDAASGVALYQESLALSQAVGDKHGRAWSLRNLGDLAHDEGDYERAAALFDECLALFQELGNKRGRAFVLLSMGDLALNQGDTARAQALYEEAFTCFQALEDQGGRAWARRSLGRVALNQGDTAHAQALLTESLAFFHAQEHIEGSTCCLMGLAGVATAQGQPKRAARLFGALEAFREAHGQWGLGGGARVDYARDLAAARAQLDEAAFAAAWAEGRALALEQAIVEALGDGTTEAHLALQRKVDIASTTQHPEQASRPGAPSGPTVWSHLGRTLRIIQKVHERRQNCVAAPPDNHTNRGAARS